MPPAATTTTRPPAATLRVHADSAKHRQTQTQINCDKNYAGIDRRRALPGTAYAGSHGLGSRSDSYKPVESSDEEAVEFKQPPVDVTMPGGLAGNEDRSAAADEGHNQPTGERLKTRVERMVYSQTTEANGAEAGRVSATRKSAAKKALPNAEFEEKKRRDAAEVQSEVQSTRERDLEKMRQTGVIAPEQPDMEIDNHKRKD